MNLNPLKFLSKVVEQVKSAPTLVVDSVAETPQSKGRNLGKREKLVSPVVTKFSTPLGDMDAAQYAAYVQSLTPDPIKRGYRTLDCGHKFAKDMKPRTNCMFCWENYYAENPIILIGMKDLIDKGWEKELVHHFGAKQVKKTKQVMANNPHWFNNPMEAAA